MVAVSMKFLPLFCSIFYLTRTTLALAASDVQRRVSQVKTLFVPTNQQFKVHACGTREQDLRRDLNNPCDRTRVFIFY